MKSLFQFGGNASYTINYQNNTQLLKSGCRIFSINANNEAKVDCDGILFLDKSLITNEQHDKIVEWASTGYKSINQTPEAKIRVITEEKSSSENYVLVHMSEERLPGLLDKVQNVKGVTSVNYISTGRYSFGAFIGKAFDKKEVIEKIVEVVLNFYK